MKSKSYQNQTDLINDYELNGFVQVKNLFDKNKIKLIRDNIELALQNFCNNDLDYNQNIAFLNKNDKKRLYEFNLLANGLITNFIVVDDILKVLNVLNLGNPLQANAGGASIGGLMLGLPRDERLTYDFHQEASYMRNVGSIFNVHFPIFQDSTILNGTMSVLSGSHKCGLLEFDKKRISSDSYTDLVPKNIDSIKSMYSEEFCELELGDCVIFNELLIHKSNYNNSDSCRTVSVWRVIANTNLSTTLLSSDEL